jgi:hypothetical protein
MIEAGYTRAPVITGLLRPTRNEVIVKGVTMPNGRARFLHNGQAIGFSADSKGRFEAKLPVNGVGEVYQFEIEDRGRLVKDEGLLFFPCCDSDRATQLRPGAASLALGGNVPPIASININAAKAMTVEGQVQAGQTVMLYLNNTKVAQTRSDEGGRYAFLTDRSNEPQQQVMIETPNQRHEVRIDLTPGPVMEADKSLIINTDQAWIIHWGLVGGGSQTTYVFKAN